MAKDESVWSREPTWVLIQRKEQMQKQHWTFVTCHAIMRNWMVNLGQFFWLKKINWQLFKKYTQTYFRNTCTQFFHFSGYFSQPKFNRTDNGFSRIPKITKIYFVTLFLTYATSGGEYLQQGFGDISYLASIHVPVGHILIMEVFWTVIKNWKNII